MKKILIVAWYFPPIGGPGTQRTSKYCKYLMSMGWIPIVITAIDPTEHQDYTLLNDIDESIEVIRIPQPKTKWFRIRRWLYDHGLGRLGTWIGYWKDFPDLKREWSKVAISIAKERFKREPFDVVYTSSYPYSVHWVGMEIKKSCGIPWVADLRDPWADNNIMLGFLPSWMRWRHYKAEKLISNKATAMTFAHLETARLFSEKYSIKKENCVGITNGYDESDYVNFKPIPPVENDVIKMVHTGSFYGDYSPESLRIALERYWDSPPQQHLKLHIKFVGGHGHNHFIQRDNLIIESIERVSQEDALREQENAHLLLNVFDKKTSSSNISGKLFGYLASRRPIFGILPEEGSMSRIIKKCNAGWVVDSDDYMLIIKTLKRIMLDIHKDTTNFSSNSEEIKKYSRQNLTEEFVNLLNRIVEK